MNEENFVFLYGVRLGLTFNAISAAIVDAVSFVLQQLATTAGTHKQML